jgi:hypothetical protein
MKPTFRHHRTAILSGLSLMMRSDLVYNELVAPMTYDHWKATNPQDEWLGSEPWERDDMSELSFASQAAPGARTRPRGFTGRQQEKC